MTSPAWLSEAVGRPVAHTGYRLLPAAQGPRALSQARPGATMESVGTREPLAERGHPRSPSSLHAGEVLVTEYRLRGLVLKLAATYTR